MKGAKQRSSKSVEVTPVGSWHNGLDKYADEDEAPFNIQFNPGIERLDDSPIQLELWASLFNWMYFSTYIKLVKRFNLIFRESEK